MQVNDEYLDELFARKLGNLETTPPEDGWFRIENELNRRRSVTRKFWLAAASFALVLSVTATLVYIQTDHTTKGELTVMVVNENPSGQQSEPTAQQSQAQNELSGSPKTAEKPSINLNPDAGSQSRRTVNPAPTQPLNEVQSETRSSEPETRNSEPETRNPELGTRNPEPETRLTEYIDSWDEIIKEQTLKPNGRLELSQNKRNQPEKEHPGNDETEIFPGMSLYNDIAYVDVTKSQSRDRWEITGQFAPMYSYRVITGVPDGLRKSDFDEAERPLPTYSGGITVAYRLFNRLSVQTGVFYAQMGQSINNVTPVTNMYAALSSNNSYSKNFVRTSSGNVTVASNVKSDVNTTYSSYFNAEPQTTAASNVPPANVSNSAKYRLIERIDYLEIPLLLRYRIIDRKVNLYILGGMSANILVNNNVFVDNSSELVKGGTILMARPVNYSSTFGLGLGYQMTEKLLIGFEPSFKYYLQSYTNSNRISSNPYALGFFTGIIYRF